MMKLRLSFLAVATLALPVAIAFFPAGQTANAAEDWAGTPTGVGSFLTSSAELDFTANEALALERLSHPRSTAASQGKNCSTKTDRLVCCSAECNDKNCSTSGRGTTCSAYNTKANSGEFCSVGGPNIGATCTSNGSGACSAFLQGGGSAHCSVAQGSGAVCTSLGGGQCSATTPNTCSVFGMPSSSGPCQG